jgi:NAD-dependent deacetylase
MDIRPSWDQIYLALTMRRMGTAAELAALIGGRGPAVVLTGAGMSTESGIPDFRSAGGIWAEVDPFEVASIDAFRRDPLRVWRWYGPRIGGLLQAKPNAGHLALASLERAGHVRTVVTQNIDLLHSRAGSADVVELHGSIREFVCLACGETEKLDGVLAQLEVREAPVCAGCGAILKPGVVMFGELLPADAMERAEQLARQAGVLVVVGSSLQVWPVAGLPSETVRAGGELAIVNDEPTPYDGDAALVVRGRAGEVLEAVLRALDG